MARLPAEEFAARAAVDAALHDLQGKLDRRARLAAARPAARRRRRRRWTIWLGDPDDMARRAEKAGDRFQRLKLKLGGGDGLDVERVRAVREVTDLPLQVDVNEAWSLDEALEALPQLASLDVAVLRAAAARRRCRRPASSRRRSSVPIYVDEDCHTLADVAACAERAHGINIKLAKSGGIREAVRMVARGTRARPRRDARLHGRVGSRDRRRRAHRVALRPRRPRREHPHRRTIPGRASRSSTASSSPPTSRDSASIRVRCYPR